MIPVRVVTYKFVFTVTLVGRRFIDAENLDTAKYR